MQSLLFSFQGRINRAKFWLVHIAMDVVFIILMGIGFGSAALSSGDPDAAMAAAGTTGIISLLLCIPLVWIGLAISVKRWHDRNKSGWWTLIGLVPLVGWIWLLVELGFLRGTAGNNDYGAMSSWAVWAFVGLYPVASTNNYTVFPPQFDRLTISVPGSGSRAGRRGVS
mgnify:CR=1 FL=1